jgi:hypothetical protein
MVRVRSAAIHRLVRNTEASHDSGTLVAKKPVHIRIPLRRKSHGRNGVSDSRGVLLNVKRELVFAQRYREISSAIIADRGGANQCFEICLQLIRRFAGAAVLAEEMKARLARGEEIDVIEHALLCRTLVRVANRIGLDRITRDHTPKLADYLQSEQMERVE